MNNVEIERLLKSRSSTRNIFRGVYPSNKIPKKEHNPPAVYIANLDPHTKSESHCIAIYIRRKKSDNEYFCSYKKPVRREFSLIYRRYIQKTLNFLWVTSPEIKNCKMLQSVNISISSKILF